MRLYDCIQSLPINRYKKRSKKRDKKGNDLYLFLENHHFRTVHGKMLQFEEIFYFWKKNNIFRPIWVTQILGPFIFLHYFKVLQICDTICYIFQYILFGKKIFHKKVYTLGK